MAQLSIGRALSWQAARDPGRLAVRYADRHGESLTRGELDDRSDRVAAAWLREGLRTDDVVALVHPGDLDFVVACVAAWKAGATPAPVSPLLEPAERDAALALLAPTITVGTGDTLPVDTPRPATLPDRWASSWKAPTSSGSTGRPKVIRAAAPARVDPEAPVASYLPVAGTQLVAAPLWHAAPFVYAMRGLMTGHGLVLLPTFSPAGWLAAVEEHRCTWGMVVPSMMAALTDCDPDLRSRADVSSVEAVLHVGARCPERVKRDWIGWLGPERVQELYAGTEAQGLTLIDGVDWLQRPGSVGRGVGGTELRVERPDGTVCAAGELGEVRMRRPRPTYDYVGAEPDVRDGWHTLGDAGWLDAAGYLFLSDRLADLVHVDGPSGVVAVSPSDVEQVVEAHPAVRACVVVGRAGCGSTAQVHAVVECDPGSVQEADLTAYVDDRLRPEQRPRTWQLVDHVLRSPAGKVRRADWRPHPGVGRAGAGG